MAPSILSALLFQSTLPCGSDAIPAWARWSEPYFNPRSLVGATGITQLFAAGFCISIHAPLRERRSHAIATCPLPYFNPRSLTGAALSSSMLTQCSAFQSTLPYGSDAKDIVRAVCCLISILAPSRERQSNEFLYCRP